MNAAGALAFARYAYPPNALGYCGPQDHRALLEHAAAGVAGRGLAQLAHGFDGAWPYLELIAGANGVRDPLDTRVVEAYWIGNPLLERVGMASLGAALVERFRGRSGRAFARLAEAVPAGALPITASTSSGSTPGWGCWGEVVDVAGGTVAARSRPLTWDGRSLRLGAPTLERAVGARDGLALAGELHPGDRVALQWDWVCERLTPRQLGALRHYTARQLAIVNGLAHPAPAAVLG
jgi:Family of unknown function (DUF6390)